MNATSSGHGGAHRIETQDRRQRTGAESDGGGPGDQQLHDTRQRQRKRAQRGDFGQPRAAARAVGRLGQQDGRGGQQDEWGQQTQRKGWRHGGSPECRQSDGRPSAWTYSRKLHIFHGIVLSDRSMAHLNLHHLRLFRAVARDGTLTGAARALNLSQSALSTQIRTLEAALGHDLFERRGRGLVLTEAGHIALDHAEAIFRTAEDLSATLQHVGTARRVLRIGALATLSRNFQIGFVRPLLGRADVEVVLRSGPQAELLRALEALSLDMVLTNLVPARDAASRYLVHELATQPVSLVGPPELAGRSLAALLASEPLILPTPEAALRAAFDAMLGRLDVVPRVAAEADDMAMLRLLARAGAGLAVIPPVVVRDELASGTLHELARLDGIVESFLAVTLQRRFPNPLVAEILGAFRAGRD
jgi:LysR family transcriptional activator of nhaA